jgi:hypothetical protein
MLLKVVVEEQSLWLLLLQLCVMGLLFVQKLMEAEWVRGENLIAQFAKNIEI